MSITEENLMFGDVIEKCNICLLANKYFHIYRLDQHLGEYHHVISLIIGQQISINLARKIRKNLYYLAGYPLSAEEVNKIDLKGINHLAHQKISTILEVTRMYIEDRENFMPKITTVKGIGTWTIKGLKILTETSFTEALHEDKYIRKRIEELCDRNLSLKQCKIFFSLIPENERSIVSYFLWRIKTSGVEKLKINACLEKIDFI